MALISPIQTLWASVRASKRECRKLKMRESKFPSLRSGVFPTIMGQQPRDRANSSQFQRSGKRSFRRFRYGSLDQLVPNFKIQHGRDSPLSNFRIRKVTFTDLDSRDKVCLVLSMRDKTGPQFTNICRGDHGVLDC